MTNDRLMANDGARADVFEQNWSFEFRHLGFVIS